MKPKIGSPSNPGSVGEGARESGVGLPEQRMWDLVRYMRGQLHTDGLITDEEFALLVVDHPAVARLEGYDALRVENARLRAEFTEGAAQSERFRQGFVAEQAKTRQLTDQLNLLETRDAENAAYIVAYEAENAELRDALQRIADLGPLPGHPQWDPVWEMQEIARAALAKAGRAQAGPVEPKEIQDFPQKAGDL
jgi:hypothetical protein